MPKNAFDTEAGSPLAEAVKEAAEATSALTLREAATREKNGALARARSSAQSMRPHGWAPTLEDPERYALYLLWVTYREAYLVAAALGRRFAALSQETGPTAGPLAANLLNDARNHLGEACVCMLQMLWALEHDLKVPLEHRSQTP